METGFIRNMLDVKVLVLYVMDRVAYPIGMQKIYDLVYQDDKLSYFDLVQAVPQMVDSGHLELIDADNYVITQRGRDASAITADTIPYPVMLRAETAVEQYNRNIRRSSFVQTSVEKVADNQYTVHMNLKDSRGEILTMELTAPSQKFAHRLAKGFSERAEVVYRGIIDQLLTELKEDS
jgi:hypothetical protein